MTSSQPKPPPGCMAPIMVVSCLIGLAVGLLIPYYLCRIDPAHHYGAWGGIWHGMNFIGNLILKLFADSRLLLAPIKTGIYSFFFYVFAFLSCLWVVVMTPLQIKKLVVMVQGKMS